MATVQPQPKSAKPSKKEARIATQLAEAERRVRFLDVLMGVSGFVIITVAFALLMVMVDRWFDLSTWVRQILFAGYAVASLVYLYYFVVRPVRRAVDPFYAAVQYEETVGASHNSLINWLDFQKDGEQNQVVRGALNKRAVRDLNQAEVEEAITNQRASKLGLTALGAFFLFLAFFFVLGGSEFASRLKRTFFPFSWASFAEGVATRIRIVQPFGGNAVFNVDDPVKIVAELDGKRPKIGSDDAPKLWLWYQPGEPPIAKKMTPVDSNSVWEINLSKDVVQSGFYYRVEAGDGRTPDYRITTRARPLITETRIRYDFPEYMGRTYEVRRERNIRSIRGTTVTIWARTNRVLDNAGVTLNIANQAKPLETQLVPNDPRAFQAKLTLTDEDGYYRLSFLPKGETRYIPDLNSYTIEALPDTAPDVKLTDPGQDVLLPVNSVLQLAGVARDDIGVKKLTLRMEIENGAKLKAKPYRPKKDFALKGGGYPRRLEYKDFVDLKKIVGEGDEAVELKQGMTIVYWLEAEDACDNPKPNVGKSKRYKVKLIEPDPDADNQQKQREQVQQEQQQHEQQQDKSLDEEGNDRDQQANDQNQKNEENEKTQKDLSAGDGDGGKPNNDPNKGEPKDNEGNPDEGNPDGSKSNEPKDKPDPKQKEQDDETRKQADKLKQALDEKNKKDKPNEKDDGKPGEGKGENKPEPAEGKSKPKPNEAKPDSNKSEKKPSENLMSDGKPSEPKDEGKRQPDENPAQGKESGMMSEDGNPSESKDAEPKEGMQEKPGEGKPDSKKPTDSDAKPGASKPGENDPGMEADSKPSTDKPTEGTPEEKPGEGKDGKPEEGDSTASTKKPIDTEPTGGKSEEKPTDPEDRGMNGMQERVAEGKPGQPNPSEGKPAEGKPSGDPKNSDEAPATAKNTGEGADGPGKREKLDPNEITPEDIERLAKNFEKNKTKGDLDEAGQDYKVLKDLLEKTKDPEVKKAIEKAIEEHGQVNPSNTASSKGEPKDQGTPGQQPGAGKSSPRKNEQTPAETKGTGPGTSADKGAEPKDDGKPGQPGGPPGMGDPTEEREGVAKKPGQPGEGKPGDVAQAPVPPKPQDPLKQPASDLQLEEFMKKVDPNVLKDAGISPEEYAKFLERYKDLARRDAVNPPADIANPQNTGTLPGIVGNPSTAKPGNPGSLVPVGRPKPPPGYRNPYDEYLKRLNR